MKLLQTLRWLLAAGLAANGAAMLAVPAAWYDAVPGVLYSGPLNLHFVRDIGAAYASAAAGLAWRAARGPAGAPAAALGALFLALHAGVHLYELLAGVCGWQQFGQDLPGVLLPALGAVALAGPFRQPPPTGTARPGSAPGPVSPVATHTVATGLSMNRALAPPPMLDRLLRRIVNRRLAAFERRWHYPMDYARALFDGSRRAFWAYARIAPAAALRDGMPAAAWHAAKIVALCAEDCGPCTQLALDMARADGVADRLLQAVLQDDRATLQALDADAAVTHAFATAWARRDSDLPARRDALRQRFGEHGLATLALALTASRMFPQLKAALGHAQACSLLHLGEHRVAGLARPAATSTAAGSAGAPSAETIGA